MECEHAMAFDAHKLPGLVGPSDVRVCSDCEQVLCYYPEASPDLGFDKQEEYVVT